MKKFLITAIAVLAGLTAANAQKIKGSDTCLPLSQKEAEEYMQSHPSAVVTVTGGGSGGSAWSLRRLSGGSAWLLWRLSAGSPGGFDYRI